MAEGELVVASAVVVPEEIQQPAKAASPPPSARNASSKRRPSSISSDSHKRLRLSVDSAADGYSRRQSAGSPQNERFPPPDRGQGPRRTSLQTSSKEEKQRGRRLFGGLLGALSQNGSAAQRRRADIEKKQQAKLKLQAEEDEHARNEHLEDLQRKRRQEQIVWDEKSMRLRHAALLAKARFLKTETEPQLYYKPFELKPEEEQRISEHIRDAQEAIGRELDEWDKQTRLAKPAEAVNPEEPSDRHGTIVNGSQDAAMNEEIAKVPANESFHTNGHVDQPLALDAADRTRTVTEVEVAAPNAASSLTAGGGEGGKEAADDGGEVVEGDEDTVIY